MLKTLLQRVAGRAEVEIPDELWERTLAGLPFVQRLDAGERQRLRALAGELLADKEMAGAAGLELDAAMQLNIAVQACLPVLNLGIAWYRGWTGIIVYPAEFLVPRRERDDDGVVHEYTEPLAGQAWERGPLLLSWEDARRAGGGEDESPHACSVVIHEFAHKIDLLDGEADGVPPFDRRLHPGIDRRRWMRDLDDAFERLNAELDLIELELPKDLDPESEAADAYYARLPLDPYAAEHPGEFFAVSSEAFFVTPGRLRDAFPAWYAQLAAFYRQDPIATG